MGGVRDYEVSGELTYVELASGGEYIADGTTYNIENLHTDAIDGADDMNIVGVRLTMSYGEDETTSRVALYASQANCTQTQSPAQQCMPDSLKLQQGKTAGHRWHATTVDIWYNASMIGVITGLSEAEIVAAN